MKTRIKTRRQKYKPQNLDNQLFLYNFILTKSTKKIELYKNIYCFIKKNGIILLCRSMLF